MNKIKVIKVYVWLNLDNLLTRQGGGGLEYRCPVWKKIDKLTIEGGDYSGLESNGMI